jgi:hypothetical protein
LRLLLLLLLHQLSVLLILPLLLLLLLRWAPSSSCAGAHGDGTARQQQRQCNRFWLLPAAPHGTAGTVAQQPQPPCT